MKEILTLMSIGITVGVVFSILLLTVCFKAPLAASIIMGAIAGALAPFSGDGF